jgi:serine protease
VLSTVVPRLAPGDSVQVAFAVLAAPTLAQLQTAAQAAQATFQTALAAAPVAKSIAWQLFPNPSHDVVRVQLPGNFGPATVQVFTTQGQLVSQAALAAGGGSLSVAALPPGLYVVRVAGAAGSLWQRLARE